jgi:hypothetical protein
LDDAKSCRKLANSGAKVANCTLCCLRLRLHLPQLGNCLAAVDVNSNVGDNRHDLPTALLQSTILLFVLEIKVTGPDQQLF